nr:hypothetical protein [Tanacetum cinerariifolium]
MELTVFLLPSDEKVEVEVEVSDVDLQVSAVRLILLLEPKHLCVLHQTIPYDDIRPVFEKHFDSNVAFLQKIKVHIEEKESRALKRINETLAEKAAKRQKLDEEVKEIKRLLQIVPNEDDDVYTKATPLARKVPVIDYEIINQNNKPIYKIIRADGTHQLYISFMSLLRNFDREELEALWSLVKERFATAKAKNFSDDFLKSQGLEAVGIIWCVDHYIYNHTADFVSREEVPTHKVHYGSDAKCFFEKHFDSNVAFLQKIKVHIEEEESRALKRINETLAKKAAKRQKLDEEVKVLKRLLQIVPNEDDDVYTEATPLARKVHVVDYEIINQNNKPIYKIIRADGTHQLYISFMSLLRNFDRKDLEALWSLVKERFATAKAKNFSDDFLLITLGAMFEKPDMHA